MFPLKSILEKNIRVNWNNIININKVKDVVEQADTEKDHDLFLFV